MDNMIQPEYYLVDLREQILSLLRSLPYHKPFAVRQHFPREPADGIILTCQEYNNCSTACAVVDEISYQIDLYAPDRETIRDLTQLVNQRLLEFGLKRTYMGAETLEQGYYEHKVLRFGRKVDKRFLRLID